MSDISDFVDDYIKKELNISDEAYSPDLDIFVCYGADQLDMIEIYMALEDEFNIEMPDLDYGCGNDFIKAAEAA